MTRLAVALAASVSLSGCSEPSTAIVHGTVTYQGQPVDQGSVRFVPIEGNTGPPSLGAIANDGQYRVEARGGVPVGKHRVEVEARCKTGRQVQRNDLMGKPVFIDGQPAMSDEIVDVGPVDYVGSKSPLTCEVVAGEENRFDIEIPE